MWLYKVEYYDERCNRVYDYILAKDSEEAMEKFNKLHPSPNERGMIVNWEYIDFVEEK